MITSLWAIVAGAALAIWAIVGPLLGHRIGASGKAEAVDQAKTDTETAVRKEVEASSAAAAGQAMKDAAASRAASVQQAEATAAQGDDALNAALKAQGALRD